MDKAIVLHLIWTCQIMLPIWKASLRRQLLVFAVSRKLFYLLFLRVTLGGVFFTFLNQWQEGVASEGCGGLQNDDLADLEVLTDPLYRNMLNTKLLIVVTKAITIWSIVVIQVFAWE